MAAAPDEHAPDESVPDDSAPVLDQSAPVLDQSVPVLDESVLETLRALGGDDDPGLLVEVIDLYLEDAALRLRDLRAALEGADVRALERAAHTLKSASANVGAVAFSRLCFELEKSARNADLDAAPSLVARAEAQFLRVRGALEAARG